MKILQVQDHLKSGGAARAAGRWACLLKKAGHDVRQAAGDEASASGFLLSGKPPRGWGRVLEYLSNREQVRKSRVERQWAQVLHGEKYDLVWFHNLAGGGKWGWSEEMVSLAREHAPVLWTLHDMWALADRSESFWDEGSAVESGKGPGAGSGQVGRCKGSKVTKVCGAEGKCPVTLTAPSKWLAELTKKISGLGCVHLPNPIDLAVFRPGDRQAARRQLGLREQGPVVLAGADSLQDSRKGFDLLREAWGRLPSGRATLALFGRHGESRPGEHYLGKLNSDEEMVAAYQSADLYVHPARMENAPCTIQESLACGTPVLAFSVGGIPEMIAPDENGFLVEPVGGSALAGGLEKALRNPSRLAAMGRGCRGAVERDYGPGVLLEKFHRLGPGFSRP